MNDKIAAAFNDELGKLAVSDYAKKRLKALGVFTAGAAGYLGVKKLMKGRGPASARVLPAEHVVKTGTFDFTPKREMAPGIVPGGDVQAAGQEPPKKKKHSLFALFADDAMMMVRKMVPGKMPEVL